MKYADELLLYAVTDRSWLGGKTLYEEVEHAIQGGVTFVQLREKRLEETAFLKEAQEIQKLCKKYHVPFVINDNVEIAARIHADGVHIGQSDMEVKKARERLGNERIKEIVEALDEVYPVAISVYFEEYLAELKLKISKYLETI